MTIEVRQARDDDREALHRLSQHAFAARPSAYDEADDRAGIPLDRRLVATDKGRIVGKLTVWELGQWFGRRRVPMGGVAGVGVDAAYRGRGVATTLIRHALGAMRERGEAFSTLYPMNHTVYRRHGWEVAGAFPQHRIDLRALATLPKPSRAVEIRATQESDLPALRRLQDSLARDEPGNLSYGSEFAARRLLAQPSGQEAYVAERAGEVVGGLVLARDDDQTSRGFYSLAARTLMAADLDAELALLRLLAAYHPVAQTVELVAPSHFALPMLLGERDLQPTGMGWCWMSRLVDAPAAVAARGFPAEVDVETHLDLHDEVAPWNSGPHVLRVKDGQGRLEPGGRGEVRLGIGTLASLFTGWASPRRLARVDLLAGADEEAVDALERALAGRTPWAGEFF